MITICTDPISKNYRAPILSRTFIITYLCYIFMLIVPALVLVSIDCTHAVTQHRGPSTHRPWLYLE